MARDGHASKERLLKAATAEFAMYGIAGARVDRIAASSGVNKGQMYGWFGSKDDLFDAVFSEQLHHIVDAVPFTAEDLPGYALRLYDSYLMAPELVRLASWNRMERVPTGNLLNGYETLSQPKFDAIACAQTQGLIIAGVCPEEIYSLVIALAGTWSPVSGTYTASVKDDQLDHDRRRKALHLTVQRAFVPPS